jgi:hypothetical protein
MRLRERARASAALARCALIRCRCKLRLDLSQLLPDKIHHKTLAWREMPSRWMDQAVRNAGTGKAAQYANQHATAEVIEDLDQRDIGDAVSVRAAKCTARTSLARNPPDTRKSLEPSGVTKVQTSEPDPTSCTMQEWFASSAGLDGSPCRLM